MDASAYAFVQGIRGTRETLQRWNRSPWPIVRGWVLGSAVAACALLVAVWTIAALNPGPGLVLLSRPPLVVGAFSLRTTPAELLAGLLPHALPELTALFLPPAAWIIASCRGEWSQLLAATLVTIVIAVPVLVLTALWEVYVAPHLLRALIGY